jgi:hypothetical protein
MKGQGPTRLLGVLLAWLTLAAALAACGSDSPPSQGSGPAPRVSLGTPAPTPSASESGQGLTADPRAAAAEQAVAAYRGMWQAYDAALRVPDPSSADLARFAADEALRVLVSGVASVKGRGLRGTGGVAVSPRVVEFSPVDEPVRVLVRDCMDSSGSRLVRASPGPPYHDTPGGRRRGAAEVRRQADGSWKVAKFGLEAVGTC